MSPALSCLTQRVERNLLAEAFSMALEMKAQGIDLIDLSLGEPDKDTTEQAKEAGIAAIQDGFTKYTQTDGTPALKAAVIAKYQREHGLNYTPDQVIADAGSKPLLSLLMSALIDAGDRVVVTLPCYSCYGGIVARFQGIIDGIALHADQGFRLLPEQLHQALGGGADQAPARLWLFNNPCNPTGVIYRQEELEAFADVLRHYPDCWVIVDEVYEKLVYDDRSYVSLAAVAPDLLDRIIPLNSISKTYAMTGWRLGYALCPLPLANAVRQIMDMTHTNPCSITQAAATAALNSDHQHLPDWCNSFVQRRDVASQMLNIDGLRLIIPQAGMFHFIDCAGLMGKRTPQGEVLHSSQDWTAYLLKEWQVITVSGAAFGLDPYFRISLVASDQEISEGCRRIVEAVQSLK